jgi:hypothetical protein
MHLWKIPEMLRLYNSPFTTVKAFDHLTIRLASTGSSVRQIEVELPGHFAAVLLLEHHPTTLEVPTLSPLLIVA